MRRGVGLVLVAALAAVGSCDTTEEPAREPLPRAAASSVAARAAVALDDAGHGPGGANSAEVATAAAAFLATLDTGRRERAHRALGDHRGRQTWSDHAASAVPRPGIALAELSPVQHAAALKVLEAALSDSGYAEVTRRMPGDAHLAVYGTPAASTPFVVQLGGEHLARNLTYRGDQVSMTPSLTGADPANSATTRAVLAALTEQERVAARLSTGVSDDLVMGPGHDAGDFPDPEGLLVSELADKVRRQVTALLAAHTGDLAAPAGDRLLAAYRAEFPRTRLSWTDSYLRVDGPAGWIEVLGDVAVFRDKTNDYGSS
ncbi:DUF3500 domain-containing protein [Actinoplanes sp. DH11]|uniref:DUF3500 domain-containing protein n=1 Tax=Actinoplanes sp. DH11 TaxID=2857011 RepID=UPI001E591406|nr:DUF3500 domain-containing protein [Actinoplanes sp. DH11]